jgi:hypothetical protein
MTAAARRRVWEGLPMSGLILVGQECPVAVAIDELELIYEATRAEEWYDVIAFLPV